jgi:uncharacterized membrane protein YgaE (UPF0421/DUF939 family)
MAKKNLVLRAFTWTVALTSLFVLTLGAVLIALVVGDWITLKTDNTVLAWVVGSTVLTGFLATLGGGIGIWLWLRGPVNSHEVTDRHDTMDKLLKDMSVIERD